MSAAARPTPRVTRVRPIRRSVAAFAGAAGTIALGAIGPTSIYLGLVTAAGAKRARREGSRPAPRNLTSDDRPTRFAVLIPAHDEAAVIEATVEALVSQRYPATSFGVHVVADNCTDATAAVARSAGATVHERDAPDDPGKGPALNWLASQVGDRDAIVIVDADTVAHSDFLLELHEVFAGGAQAVQGDYGVLDPGQSTAVGLRFAALACRHRLRPLGRAELGCSCGLFGNGMAFLDSVLAERAWSGHLVEDAEFQFELLLDGIMVVSAPAARIEAEMPTTLEGSITQHQRWELGRAQLISRFVPPLMRAAVRPPDGMSRRVYVDAIVDLLVPPLSMLAAANVVAVTANATSHVINPRRSSATMLTLSLLTSFGLVGHVVLGLRAADAPSSVWRSLLGAPRLIVWKLMLLAGIARRPDDVSWTRTERNTADARNGEAAGGVDR